jgi:hypothetical protein
MCVLKVSAQTFVISDIYKFPTDFYSGSLLVDINKDGYEDLIYADKKDVFLFLNTSGSKIQFEKIKILSDNTQTKTFQVVDLDIDGDLDILVGLSGRIIFLENKSTSSKTEFVKSNRDFLYFLNKSSNTPSMLVYDINQDSLPDIVVAYGETKILFQKPDKTFFTNDIAEAKIDNIVKIKAVDINRDNKVDLIFCRNKEPGSAGLFYFLNSNNTFGKREMLVMDQINDFFIADVTNDGYPDIIAMDNNATGTLRIFESMSGDSAHFNLVTLQTGFNFNNTSVIAGELDYKPGIDFAMGFEQEVGVKLLLKDDNVPAGYHDDQISSSTDGSKALYTGDLDHDGDADIIVILPDDGFLVCENRLISETKDLSTINLSIFPNPVNEFTNIIASSEINEVKVYDSSGALVKSIHADRRQEYMLNLDDINAGIYFLEVRLKNSMVEYRKIIRL